MRWQVGLIEIRRNMNKLNKVPLNELKKKINYKTNSNERVCLTLANSTSKTIF